MATGKLDEEEDDDELGLLLPPGAPSMLFG